MASRPKSKTSRAKKSPSKPRAKPKATRAKKPARKVRPSRNPAEGQMLDGLAEIAEILLCPVKVAATHAASCLQEATASKAASEIAVIAHDLHVNDPSELSKQVALLLVEYGTVMHGHASVLAGLADRFLAYTNHDLPHQHVELGAIPFEKLMDTMFGADDDEVEDGT